MNIDFEKMVTTFSAIFTIVIISATGVQNIINDRFRKLLVNNTYIKHSILIATIYSTKAHEIIQFSDNDENSFSLNLLKSIIMWIFLLLLFKINFNLIVIIIAIVIGGEALNRMKIDKKIKKSLIKISNYGIIIVYVIGVSKYFFDAKDRDKKSILNSILKTF